MKELSLSLSLPLSLSLSKRSNLIKHGHTAFGKIFLHKRAGYASCLVRNVTKPREAAAHTTALPGHEPYTLQVYM